MCTPFARPAATGLGLAAASRLGLGLIAIAGALAAGCPRPWQAPPPALAARGAGTSAPFQVSLLGPPLVLPPGLQVEGLDVGGLSGLAYLGGNRYLAISDNQGTTPSRLFELELAVGPDGPAPLPGRSARDLVVGAVRLAGFDGMSLDAEALAVTPGGTVLVTSERGPAIREFSRDGRLLATLPVPEHFLATWLGGGIARNLAFEGLTLADAGDTLWTGTERALRQDGAGDAGAGNAGASSARLLRYQRTAAGFAPDRELVYPLPAIAEPGSGFAVRGLSELLAVVGPEGTGGRLLALEREYVEGRGHRIEIYAVDTAGATDVAGFDALAGHGEVRPVGKTLVYDFAAAGFPPDNVEGMTLGPDLPDGDRTLVLVSDDNFDREQATQVIALRLHAAAPRAPQDRRHR